MFYVPCTPRSETEGRVLIHRTCAALLTLMLMLFLSVPALADDAYTVLDIATLAVLDFDTGNVSAIGTTGVPLFALAVSPEGVLYAAGKPPGLPENPLRLWIVDPETAELQAVGILTSSGVALLGDLTFDAAGNLWVTIDGQLHSVDLDDGSATPIGTPGDLYGLATRGSDLFGLEMTDPYEFLWSLVAVDPGSGTTTPIAPLPELDGKHFVGMDFDFAGRLWIVGIVPGAMDNTLYRIADPALPDVETLFDLSGAGNVEALAIIPPRGPIEVPALDAAGQVLLAALLLASALIAFRRPTDRRPPGRQPPTVP